MTRRHLLTSAAALLAVHGDVGAALAGRRLGMVIHSFSSRWRSRHSSIKHPAFRDVLDVMDFLRGLGTGSLQIGVDGWTLDLAHKARASCESYDMRLEGILRLPQGAGDVERCTRDLRLGQEAGIRLFRVAAGGRRYETFTTREQFELWLAQAKRSLELAEPVARRLGVRLAIENHKDFEADELLAVLDEIASPQLGVCLDTGNSLALLEEPLEVVRKLAPRAFTIHLKDIAVRPVETGFEMAEVPLGQGMLDLPAMVAIISEKAPEALFHLEMITRDPLLIPCLRDDYWGTFPEKPGLQLVQTLKRVRESAAKELPHVSDLSDEALAAQEEKNVHLSLSHAASGLGFSQMNLKALLGEER